MLSSPFLNFSFTAVLYTPCQEAIGWKTRYFKSGFLCWVSLTEARVVKRENEKGMVLWDRQKYRGKKNDELEWKTGIDKSKGNVLGERQRVFYCALMSWINAIINKQSAFKLIWLKGVKWERMRQKRGGLLRSEWRTKQTGIRVAGQQIDISLTLSLSQRQS